MKTIYLVECGWNYEGSRPIRAFASKHQAKDLADACTAYQSTRPTFPGEAPSDEELSAWCDLDSDWRAKHPGGDGSGSADFFHVTEIDFDESEPA